MFGQREDQELGRVRHLLGPIRVTIDSPHQGNAVPDDQIHAGEAAFIDSITKVVIDRSRELGYGLSSKRDVAVLRLIYHVPLRSEEAVSLDVADVDIVAILGNGRSRREAITFRLVPKTWLNERGSEPGALFLNVDRWGPLVSTARLLGA